MLVPGAERFASRVEREHLTAGKAKVRLDAFLTARLGSSHSRARVQAAIRAGHVAVNGRVTDKAAAAVMLGDSVDCVLLPGPSLVAMPEPIPLDIVYEDDHLMVVNKPAGMAVHISPGHHSGTLVNALLAHCGLPGVRVDPTYPSNLPAPDGSHPGDRAGPADVSLQGLAEAAATRPQQGTHAESELQGLGVAPPLLGGWGSETDDVDVDEDEAVGDEVLGGQAAQQGPVVVVDWGGGKRRGGEPTAGAACVLRPGIVHRLDLGTSGLLVVAKREAAQRALCAQFKARTVGRVYESITCGSPSPPAGRVMTNIDRDPSERKRMAVLPYGSRRGRPAASNYQTLAPLAGGGAALVQWRLETGRTHQIRVHAKHIGTPLVGDVTYGGAPGTAVSAITRGHPSWQPAVRAQLATFTRPALHARSLCFDHPATGQRLSFEADMPPDMRLLLTGLQKLSV